MIMVILFIYLFIYLFIHLNNIHLYVQPKM